LIQRSNSIDYVGICAIYTGTDKEFMYPDLMMKFRPFQKLNSNFLQKAIIAPFNRDYFKLNAKGSQKTMPKINQGCVINTVIPLPPLAEQKEIVRQFESLMAKVDELEKEISQRENTVKQLLQNILKDAFEGPEVKQEICKGEEQIKPFEQMQLIGAVISALDAYNQNQGEMIIAKYLYILAFITKMDIGFKFRKWHFGPYDPQIKRRISNRKFFFKHGKAGYETYSVINQEILFKYPSQLVTDAKNTLPEIVHLFAGEKNVFKRDHRIELLATVLKVIEDSGKSSADEVYSEMTLWKTDKNITGFVSKAEKFSKDEASKCLEFVKKQGWI
jgi:hypothetical protein